MYNIYIMENSEIDITALNSLDEKEKELALKILQEYSEKGNSKQLEALLYEDYQEIPVDIITFIDDPRYLGNGTLNGGKSTVFPYWRDLLKEIFPDNITTKYNTLVLSGSIGIGKSFCAVICVLYMLYRTMCLKDPYKHYGLQKIDVITFSFMNITLSAAEGVAWSKCQELLKCSPWFMTRGHLNKSQDNPSWVAPNGISLIYGSRPEHLIGRCLFCNFADEISFMPNSDINIQIEKAKKLISAIDARMKSRFMKGEELPTLNILASSKRTSQSFLETYIEMKKKNESKTTRIIDEPQWVVRTDKDSPNKFAVAIGDKTLSSEVLPLDVTNSEIQKYKDRGYSILMVPMGYYENFIDDLDIALTDIAGISTVGSMKFISGSRWADCRNDGIVNPFNKEVLEVGNGKNDDTQYYDFFDIKKVPAELMERPLYIHLDMSISGDKTGIAGVWIKQKAPSNGKNQSNSLYYRLAFSCAIKAPKGCQVSFEKNKNFIYWLRDKGFNIKKVTCFKGNTMICTPNGYKRIDEICEGDVIYSYDENRKSCVIDKVLNVSNNGPKREFIKIFFNDTEFIECTPEHLILTSSGYKTAESLTISDELIVDAKMYLRNILLNITKATYNKYVDALISNILLHTDIAKRLEKILDITKIEHVIQSTYDNVYDITVKNNHNFILQSGLVVHNCDTFQSAPVMQDLIAHGFDCSVLSVDRLTGEGKNKICEPYHYFKTTIYDGRIETYPTELLTDEIVGLEKMSDGHIDHTAQGINCLTGDTKVSLIDGRELTMLELVDEFNDKKINYVYSINEDTLNIEIKPIINAFKSGVANTILKITLDNNDTIFCTPEHKFMLNDGSYIEAKDLSSNNFLMTICKHHERKIKNIEIINNCTDVYDLTIADNPNFLLASGIFVHNSKDISDSVCGATFEASKHAEEFAYEFGESLDIINDVNLTNSAIADNYMRQVTVDFEQEMLRANNPFKDISSDTDDSLPSVIVTGDSIIW